jgi:serine/threonine protein kinase
MVRTCCVSSFTDTFHSHIAELLDTFEFQESICMVFPLYGKSLLELIREREKQHISPALTSSEIKIIGRQLLKTLACKYLHYLGHSNLLLSST